MKTIIPEIKEIRKWNAASVRNACIKHNLYTCGTNDSYNRILEKVNAYEPTKESIYVIASDIYLHSEENTIENIMFILSSEAVKRFYTIEEN